MRSPKILGKFLAPILCGSHGRTGPFAIRIVQKNKKKDETRAAIFLQWLDDGGHVVDESRLRFLRVVK